MTGNRPGTYNDQVRLQACHRLKIDSGTILADQGQVSQERVEKEHRIHALSVFMACPRAGGNVVLPDFWQAGRPDAHDFPGFSRQVMTPSIMPSLMVTTRLIFAGISTVRPSKSMIVNVFFWGRLCPCLPQKHKNQHRCDAHPQCRGLFYPFFNAGVICVSFGPSVLTVPGRQDSFMILWLNP